MNECAVPKKALRRRGASFRPDYPGGTSLQRWHRKLLRDEMESEGFTVYEAEWWHFDFMDWQQYPIMNLPFDRIISQRRTK